MSEQKTMGMIDNGERYVGRVVARRPYVSLFTEQVYELELENTGTRQKKKRKIGSKGHSGFDYPPMYWDTQIGDLKFSENGLEVTANGGGKIRDKIFIKFF